MSAAYKDHKLAELMPLMTQPELRELAGDIRENGLLAPVTLYEGKILDGRNRYRACRIAGVEPKFREFKGKDALAFVLSANLHRRHLNESQRAVIAAKLTTMTRGRPSEEKIGTRADFSPAEKSARVPIKTSVAEAARELEVSPRIVGQAKQALREAAPEDIEAVERGERTLHDVSKKLKEQKRDSAQALDKTGYPIPDKILPDWRHAEEQGELLRDLSRVKVRVKRALEDRDLAYREISNTLLANLQNVYTQLKAVIPYAVCATCQGHSRASCALCKGRGFISEFAYKQYVPAETKELRRRARA